MLLRRFYGVICNAARYMKEHPNPSCPECLQVRMKIWGADIFSHVAEKQSPGICLRSALGAAGFAQFSFLYGRYIFAGLAQRGEDTYARASHNSAHAVYRMAKAVLEGPEQQSEEAGVKTSRTA